MVSEKGEVSLFSTGERSNSGNLTGKIPHRYYVGRKYFKDALERKS